MVPPEITIGADGDLNVNSTVSDLAFLSLQGGSEDSLPKLGRQFLSSSYVMLNQDAGTFTMWAGNPSTTQNLVAVDEAGNVLTGCEASTTNGSDSATNTTTPSVSSSATPTPIPKSSKLGGGAIAGIAIGGVAIIAAIVALIFWLRRRGRHNPQRLPPTPLSMSERSSPPTPPYASRPRQPQELSSERAAAELASTESGQERAPGYYDKYAKQNVPYTDHGLYELGSETNT